MSPRSQHPTLGFLPTAQSLTCSGASTSNNSPTDTPGSNITQRPPFTISGNHNSVNKMANNLRSGAGSPSHDSGGANRIFSKRAREIKAQEGVQVNVWGPPTSGNSTPLRENIPESPTDGFPDYSNQSVQDTKSNNTMRRARAGTVPSRFSPGGINNAKTILPSITKTARQTPPSSFKSPSPVSSENTENRNAAFLSRLRAGTMPQRSQYTPSSAGPFGPSVFSTNWASGRDRTSTMASTTSQGSYNPTSPSQSAFSRETMGDNDMQMRTLDYLGLADTPHIAEIGVHKNGTWAAQKIIDVCKTPKQMNMIVKNLHPYAVPLFLDQYGNYVLQCCLKFGSPFNDFIFESMLSQMWEIAQGRYGARAMRACLESHHSTKEQQRMLASTIALHSVQLATSANGALLLTWFLDTCTFPQRRSVLAPQLLPHLVHLCTHKVAYLTVLKGINQKQEPEAKDKIYRAIFFSPNDEVLEAILSDHACGATLIFKVLTTPFFDESLRSDVVENVRKVLIRLKAQPGQGYKRLMDEVGLSARGASNGISREHSSNSITERLRLSSNQSPVTNLQRTPQKFGNVYIPQMPISDLDLALDRPFGIDPNLQPYLPYSPLINNPLFSPINLQQLQYQQSLLVRTGSPMNNMQMNNQSGLFGINGGSPGPDHFRNQNSHQLTNMGTNIPPGFGGTGTPGLGNFGHVGVNASGMSYGLQSQEPQANERTRRT